MQGNRNYPMKNVEMLTIAGVIANYALEDQAHFQELMMDWDQSYFEEVRAKVKEATARLGENSLGAQRRLTVELSNLLEQTAGDFSRLKGLIAIRLRGKADKIAELERDMEMSLLDKVKAGDQEALTQMLASFTRNKDKIAAELTAHNINPNILDRIEQCAEVFQDLNIQQEMAKNTRKKTTEELQEERNEIYTQISDIARVGKMLASMGLVDEERYTMSRILSGINAERKQNSSDDGGDDADVDVIEEVEIVE